MAFFLSWSPFLTLKNLASSHHFSISCNTPTSFSALLILFQCIYCQLIQFSLLFWFLKIFFQLLNTYFQLFSLSFDSFSLLAFPLTLLFSSHLVLILTVIDCPFSLLLTIAFHWRREERSWWSIFAVHVDNPQIKCMTYQKHPKWHHHFLGSDRVDRLWLIITINMALSIVPVTNTVIIILYDFIVDDIMKLNNVNQSGEKRNAFIQ